MKIFSKKSEINSNNKRKTHFFLELNEDNSSEFSKKVKKTLRIIKICIYALSSLMIFWSFIQSFAAPYTNYSQKPGSGLEFGFFPGEKHGSGDYRYDLSSLEINPLNFHAFYMPTVKYGPFLSFFVYPFAYIFLNLIYKFQQVSKFLENSGLNVILSMLIIMLFTRTITFLTTLRSTYYTDKQHEHRTQINNINAKYDSYSLMDKKIRHAKQKEVSAYNKRNKLKPFAPLENFFINTPIFLIVFKLITITRPIKFTKLFGIWELSKTPSNMIFYHLFENGWTYLLLCLIIIPVNYLSQKTPLYLSKIRNKNFNENADISNPYFENSKKIQRIMTFVFLLFTFFWSTGLAVYYFLNSLFTITQSFLIHCILKKYKKRQKTFENKLKKFGIY